MKVNRNDLCPCGSGKKYKKCCMKKEQQAELKELKLERFFDERHQLVLKLKQFIESQHSMKQLLEMKNEFRERSSHTLARDVEEGYFQYWMNFFHTFENGKRGIEWFVEERSRHLSEAEIKLAEKWSALKPRLVQAVEKLEFDIVFEDVFTKEQYAVPQYKEHNGAFLPWAGTISLIEPFEDKNYFNGVRTFRDPNVIYKVKQQINQWIDQTNETVPDLVFSRYPEILSIFLNDKRENGESKSKEVHQYSLEYEVLDEDSVSEFLYGQEDFLVEKWEQNDKSLSWVGNRQSYKDNELGKDVQLVDLYGTFSVSGGRMQFISLDLEKTAIMKERLGELENKLVLLEEQDQVTYVPAHFEVKNTLAQLAPDIPQYFALYAQNHVDLNINQPIPLLDGSSLLELVQNGRAEEAEVWLRKAEYNIFNLVSQRFPDAKTTADFNTVRKQLGFELSPFVTGGDKRTVSIEKIENGDKQAVKHEDAEQEDVELVELGFQPEEMDRFYALDIVRFFKEKTEGKKDATIRKYKNRLAELREMMSGHLEISQWGDCSNSYWEELLKKDYFNLAAAPTKTQVKDFISVLKAFVKWIDQVKGTELSSGLNVFLKLEEKALIEKVEKNPALV